MTKIIPLTDLRNTKAISDMVIENPTEPVFVTKHGREFLVLLSHEEYKKLVKNKKGRYGLRPYLQSWGVQWWLNSFYLFFFIFSILAVTFWYSSTVLQSFNCSTIKDNTTSNW
ncbi:type II toxin-antitoxin system Phd/YefM family antitoxin [Cytobacillus sp. Sa5YUA1]|uniref:Type II toxin-antitoxin system Phd/YefM family antitoxin n=1 Tax=Cytobacillus stercorigallinarum TaxID=2762240 RepID=A0ABR8QQK2_9BACI|nr:type II toxin-antitoxin system Phd/YefM family antitoxin [Cytobacillus stercorigallinarum]